MRHFEVRNWSPLPKWTFQNRDKRLRPYQPQCHICFWNVQTFIHTYVTVYVCMYVYIHTVHTYRYYLKRACLNFYWVSICPLPHRDVVWSLVTQNTVSDSVRHSWNVWLIISIISASFLMLLLVYHPFFFTFLFFKKKILNSPCLKCMNISDRNVIDE